MTLEFAAEGAGSQFISADGREDDIEVTLPEGRIVPRTGEVFVKKSRRKDLIDIKASPMRDFPRSAAFAPNLITQQLMFLVLDAIHVWLNDSTIPMVEKLKQPPLLNRASY